MHSEVPFIAGEGKSMEWIADYARHPNITIAINAPRMLREMRFYLSHLLGWSAEKTYEKVIYLPNYYPQNYKHKHFRLKDDYVDISCFGALRPLKNQLLQAIAAANFANSIGRKLRFHINSGRIEMNGEPVIRNLVGLFQNLAERGHELISHEWRPRDEFLELCEKMDIGLQSSFSETFNIVAADHLSQGVPVISSTEIPWADHRFCANPVDSIDIYAKLHLTALLPDLNCQVNIDRLTKYTDKTENIWVEHFGKK